MKTRLIKMLKTGKTQTKDNWRDNWITPPEIINLVNEFFNGHFFDPCPKDPKFDGLQLKWSGKNFINPPFSKYQIWVDYGLKQPNEQIWLCNSNTETKYYQKLLKHSCAICFPGKRISFIDPRTGKQETSPRQGQTIFYIGFDGSKFRKIFNKIGYVVIK